MRWYYKLRLRLRSILRRSRVEDELGAEFQYHLDRQVEQNAALGMDSDEAHFAALRAIEGLELRKEQCRDRRGVAFADHLAQDLRYAARMMWKKPAFTLVAVLSLALGIGVNTAVFSLLNTLLLTKLPVREPDKLYQLIAERRTATSNDFSYANYQKLQSGFTLFDGVTIWDHNEWGFQADQSRVTVHGALVAGNFYDFLGIKPAIGRLIEPGDDTTGGASVAVLGYGFWQRQFSGDPGVLGKVIQIEGSPFTVIGVTQAAFGGAEADSPRDVILPVHAVKLYAPRVPYLENPGTFAFSVLVRLKPGITPGAARPVLRDLWPRLEEGEAPMATDNWRPKLDIAPGGFGVSRVRSEFSQALVVVMVLVALVLLIMCANLASLLLARALGRRKEIAVRLAIGANRWRLIRQSLTEALLLSAVGGAAGLPLAGALSRALLRFLPAADSGFLGFHLDGPVVAFALLFGLLPAFQSVRVPLNVVMSEAGRSQGMGRRSRLTRAVVVMQVSVSLVLVIGSLLFAKSLQNISSANLGFQRDSLYLVDLNPSHAGIRGEQSDLLYKRVADELNATPGVAGASISRVVPLSGGQWWDSAAVPGHQLAPNEVATVYLNQVSPGYFHTFGIPVLEGREFTVADERTSRRVAIVNESFVRHFFEGKSPIGRIVNLGYGLAFPSEQYSVFRNLAIVGVVANSKYSDPRETQKDLLYIATYQGRLDITGTIAIRMAPGVTPSGAESQIRAAVNRLASGLDVDVRPYHAVFERSLQRDKMVAVLSGLFGALGLVLACIGLYGVMSQSVVARTSEIGIRMTLGARAGQVQRMVLSEALLLIVLGGLTGVPLAFAAVRLTGGLLFGVRPSDPQILLGAFLLMALVGVISAWLPARRASRIDPSVALRDG
jgi:putative ABC transport system permease protein